jgi:polar amino acid transport system substrate-binding protein
MRKARVLFVLVAGSLVLASCGGQPPATTATTTPGGVPGMPNLGGRTVTVAVENAYPPFNDVRGSTGAAFGWDYDALAEICRRLNCVPEFKQTPWEGVFAALAAGTFDMAANGISVTPERDQQVDFSTPYMTVGQVLVVPFAATVDDLASFQAEAANLVGTQAGTTNETAAKANFAAERVRTYADFDAAVAALQAGEIQAVMADTVTAARIVAGSGNRLKLGPQISSDEPLAFAFPPASPLLEPFNAALKAMQQDGTLDAINNRWFRP